MREPYNTLLGQYWNHWLLWKFFEDDVPDFTGIADCDLLGALSSGEIVMLHIAWAIYNGDRTARVSDIAKLDTENRQRVLWALGFACEALA